jgi:hypothetical protein
MANRLRRFAPEMVRFVSQKLCGIRFRMPHPEGCYPRSNLAISLLLRKEVIQPLVPQRLPCYDFIPVINHTLGAFLLIQGWINDFGCNSLP